MEPIMEHSEQDVLAAFKAKRVAAQAAATEQPGAETDGQAAGTQAPPALAAQGDAQKVEGQAEQAPTLPERLSVTYKGDDGADVTEEVPLNEVKAGYMRMKDHTHKTMELAKERADIPKQAEAAVTEARKQYLDGLNHLKQLVVASVLPELQGVDWVKLSQENPSEYVRLRGRQDQAQNVLRAIQAQEETQKAQATAKEGETRQRKIADTIATLKREIPGYTDQLYTGLLQGAVKHYGYEPENYASRIDARDILVLNDAIKYRELMAKKPATEAALKNAPAALKPGAVVGKTDIDQARIERSRKALQESGEVDDAVGLLRAKRARQGA